MTSIPKYPVKRKAEGLWRYCPKCREVGLAGREEKLIGGKHLIPKYACFRCNTVTEPNPNRTTMLRTETNRAVGEAMLRQAQIEHARNSPRVLEPGRLPGDDCYPPAKVKP